MNNYGYIQVKEPISPDAPVLKFNDNDVGSAAVFKVLKGTMSVNSPSQLEIIAEVANRIVTEVKGINKLSLSEQMMEYGHHIIANRQLAYVHACGIAAFWELSLKELALKLEVQIFEQQSSKNAKSPGLKPLEPIIADVKKMGPKLGVLLTKHKNLRDSLIHGNFHQLKTHAEENRPKLQRDKMKGTVVHVSVDDFSVQKMDEIKDLEKIKKIGLFGWFLNVASSEVIELTIDELKIAIDDLQNIITFHAYCFGPRKGLFEKVFVDGIPLTQKDIELFNDTESSKRFDELFFKKINNSIKK